MPTCVLDHFWSRLRGPMNCEDMELALTLVPYSLLESLRPLTEAILNPRIAKRLWFSLKIVCLFIVFKINPKTLRFLNVEMLVLVYPWWQVNHVSVARVNQYPPMHQLAVLSIGWVGILHLVPDLALTNLVPQTKFLGYWPLNLFFFGCFFSNLNHITL
jgi:hypothetical protein